MDPNKSSVSRIEAYRRCPNPVGGALEAAPLARSGSGEVNAGASEQFAAACHDWMDAEQRLCTADAGYLRFLRRILDVGGTSAPMLKLAVECLDHAERLLQDERRAWRRLSAMIDQTLSAAVLCPEGGGITADQGPNNLHAEEVSTAAYLDWMSVEQQLCASDSDCIAHLRRILEVGDTSAPTLRLAVECLEHAERLLEDERHAWRRLTAAQAPESAASACGMANRT